MSLLQRPSFKENFGKRIPVNSKTGGETGRSEYGSIRSATPKIKDKGTEERGLQMAPLVIPKQGLYVEGTVRTTSVQFLIDTGSTDTIISGSVYYQIPKEKTTDTEQ